MWLVLAGLAWAAPFAFVTSPGATLEVMPQVEAGRTEVVVQGNREDIRLQLGYDARPGLRAWSAYDVGTSWVLNVWMTDPATRLEVRREGDRWVGYVQPAAAKLDATLVGPEPPLADLLHRPPDTEVCAPSKTLPLVPLRGRDMMHAYRPSDFRPELPRWSEAEPARGAGWPEVKALRAKVASLREPEEIARSNYQLGALHRDLGHHREAAYYFARADAAGVPDGIARIQRAGVFLRIREWSRAREEALRASEAGAPDIAVLEVAGVAALMGQDAATAPIGRAIARGTSRPQASLLAGALLMRASCASEAILPLTRARMLVGETDAMGRMLLSDAYLLSGDRRRAATTIARVATKDAPVRWRGMLGARSRLAAMLTVTPDQWPSFVPSLQIAARDPGELGAESLYLLGQVGETLADVRLAHDSYSRLLDRSRHFAEGETGRRMVTIWSRRLGELLAANRTMDAVTYHAGTWRSVLLPLVKDAGLLRSVAEAASALGLHDPALLTLRDVATLEGQQGADDRRTLLAIADAYRASGRYEAALETLDFLRARARDPLLDARARLIRARTYEQQGRGAEARAGYGGLLAPGVPVSIADEARLRLALLRVEDGRCDEALADLSDVAFYPPDLSAGIVGIARSRCLFTKGDATAARAAAAAAVPWLSAPQVAAWADYLARIGADTRAAGSRLTSSASAPAAPTDPTAPAKDGEATSNATKSDIWTRLLAEEAADAALRARVPQTAVRK